MGATFNQIVSKFKTVPTVTVKVSDLDCSFEIVARDSWIRAYVRKRDKLVEAGLLPKINARFDGNSVLKTERKNRKPEAEENDSKYILGSPERDIEFFIEHILVNWSGIVDDKGIEIPYSKEQAKIFFNPENTAVYNLVSSLITESNNDDNFVDEEANDAVKK